MNWLDLHTGNIIPIGTGIYMELIYSDLYEIYAWNLFHGTEERIVLIGMNKVPVKGIPSFLPPSTNLKFYKHDILYIIIRRSLYCYNNLINCGMTIFNLFWSPNVKLEKKNIFCQRYFIGKFRIMTKTEREINIYIQVTIYKCQGPPRT